MAHPGARASGAGCEGSPGAPFRHFPSRDALTTAVAGEAQRRFRAEIDAALAEVPDSGPLARFRALGLAYLRWAMRRPIWRSSRAAGILSTHDLKRVQIAGRARVYGFARLNIDGYFPRWGIAEQEAGPTAEAILDLFIEGIASKRPAR